MANWYVSNAASNGYAMGSNLNAGTSPSVPVLTWVKAVSLASGTDTINGNPSGIAYAEDNATLGLSIPSLSNLTLQTDQSLLTVGKCTIRGVAATSSRVLNVGGSLSTVTFNDLVFDGENARNIVNVSAGITGGLIFTRCDFRNQTSSFSTLVLASTGNIVTLTDCTADTSVYSLIDAGSASVASFLVDGGTWNCTRSMFNLWPGSGRTCTLLHITGATISSSSAANGQVHIFGTVTTLEIDNCELTGNYAVVHVEAGHAATVPNLLFHDNMVDGVTANPAVFFVNGTSSNLKAYDNECTADGGLVIVQAENVTNAKIYGNDIDMGANGAAAPIALGPIGAGFEIHDNDITQAATASVGCILAGTDGYRMDSQNQATQTGSQNLADVSGNTFVSQQITTSAASSSARSSYFAGVLVNMFKVGSPTGNVSCALYTNNAGVPGTLIETSATVVTASDLTTSSTLQFFQFSGHPLLAPATAYHLVFTSSGSVDGSNYFRFQRNGTVTNGSLSTSTLGPGNPWVNAPTLALLYIAHGGSFAASDGLIYDNAITVEATASNLTHGIECGAISGTKVYGNQVYGASIGYLTKDAFNCLISNNLYYSTQGTQGGCYNKGGQNCDFKANTIIQKSGGGSVALLVGYNNALGQNAPLGSGVVKDNIFRASFSSGTNYVYSFSANPLGTYPTSLTVDYNIVSNGSNTSIEQYRYSSWASLQGAGYETHGQNVDPLLVNETTPSTPADFTPTLTSPAIGSGLYLTDVTTDFNGNGREFVTTIGALLYSASTFDALVRSPHAWNRPYFFGRSIVADPGKVLNRSTGVAEYWTDANITSYAVFMTEDGTSGGWKASIPPQWPEDRYRLQYSVSNQTADTAVLGDTVLDDPAAVYEVNWTGTAQAILPATNADGEVVASSVETVNDKTGYSLSPTGQPFSNGTVTSSPTSTSFIGDSGLSSVSNFYRNGILAFTSGTLKGRTRPIATYNGSTKEFTFETAWLAVPAVNDTFDILGGGS